MRIRTLAAISPALLILAACGGSGDDKLGEQAQEAMENRADAMDEAADNLSGAAADMMEANAEATREAGDAKEEAIDDSDVDASALSPEQRNALVNSH